MSDSTVYILIAVVAFLAIGVLVLMPGGRSFGQRLTPLASIAFILIVAGVVFGDNRTLGYSLMGAGVLVAVADIIIQRRNSK